MHSIIRSLINAVDKNRSPYINTLRLASAVQNGETATFGSDTFEIDFTGNRTLTTGRKRVDLSASPTLAAAGKTGTFSGNLSDGDTISVGGEVYTAKASLESGGSARQFLIGGSATITRNNFVAAAMAGAGAGTAYGTGTVANAAVTAVASSTADVVLTAKAKGTVGNAIVLAESATNFAWAGGATLLSGGVDATAAEAADAFALCSTNNVSVSKIASNEVLFVDTSSTRTSRPKSCTETLAGSNNVWASSTSFGGVSVRETVPASVVLSRSPVAQEITLNRVHFIFDFIPNVFMVQVLTSTGAVKAFGGTIVKSNNRITLTNTGSTDLVATDVVTIAATE